MQSSTGGRVKEENLHCGFVTDRRLAHFNGPTRVVSFEHRPLYPMNGEGGFKGLTTGVDCSENTISCL